VRSQERAATKGSSGPFNLPPARTQKHCRQWTEFWYNFVFRTFTDLCGDTPDFDIDRFVNCNWLDTRWQQYSTHLHINSTQNDTINLGRVRAVPLLCELYPGICLTTEEKARKNLSQGSRRVPVGTMKTEYTEQGIHNNKNT
jgi:hypothetical protein